MYKRSSSDFMMDSSRPIGGGLVDYGFSSGGFSSDFDSKSFNDFSSFPSGMGGSGGSDFYVGGGGINTGGFGGGSSSGRGFGGGLGGAPRGRGGITRGGGASRGAMQGPNRGGGRFNGSSLRGSAGGSRGGTGRGGVGLGRGAQRGGASRGGLGGSGKGGSNADAESGYLQDHQGHFPDEYWCKVCNAKTTGPGNYKAHMMGIRHMQNVKNLEKGEPLIRTGPLTLRKRKLEHDEGPSDKKTLRQMLSKVNDPIVGLEYVTEIVREGSPPDYNCELCTCRTLQGNIIFHLIGFRHRLAYINKHKPDIAAIIESVAKEDAEEDKANADGAPKGTANKDEERKNKSTRGKQSEKLKEFIDDVAAGCRGKTHKIKRVKAENIGLQGVKKAVPSQNVKGFQQNNPGFSKGRGGAPPARGRGGLPGRGGPSTGFDRSSGGFAGRGGGRGALSGCGAAGGGRGGAVGGRGGALGGRGGALGGRGAALGSFSTSLGSQFGSSPNGGGFGRGAGPTRGGFGSSLSSGRTLDDDMGGAFNPRGRGRGIMDYEDARDLGGGYDLPPPPTRRDADIEAIKTEILDSLKRDSVTDAFILREFERRFGSSRRVRGDAYDDYDHNVDMPLPGGREPPLPTREILGFRDMAPMTDHTPQPPVTVSLEQLSQMNTSQPNPPPLKSCLKKPSYSTSGQDRMTSGPPGDGQSNIGPGSSLAVQDMFSNLSESMITNEADARLAKQVADTLSQALITYESKQGMDRSDPMGGYHDLPRGRSLLPQPPPLPPFGGPGYSRL